MFWQRSLVLESKMGGGRLFAQVPVGKVDHPVGVEGGPLRADEDAKAPAIVVVIGHLGGSLSKWTLYTNARRIP